MTLEKLTKEKIEPLLEEAMQKYLGVTINELEADISDKLSSSKLLGFPVSTHLSYKAAKKIFKKEFLLRTLSMFRGNITKVAEAIAQDRRTVHRDIISLGIDVGHIKDLAYPQMRKNAVDTIIRSSLDTYKPIIKEDRLDQLYQHSAQLSASITKHLPQHQMTWKEALHEFDVAYFSKLVEEEQRNITKIAKRADLRYETTIRKIKSLGL